MNANRRSFLKTVGSLLAAAAGVAMTPSRAASAGWAVALYDGARCVLPPRKVSDMPPESWVGETKVFRPRWEAGGTFRVQANNPRIVVMLDGKMVLELGVRPDEREWLRRGLGLVKGDTFTIEAPVTVRA